MRRLTTSHVTLGQEDNKIQYRLDDRVLRNPELFQCSLSE